ncbi:ScbA/BarX family gamma-butyrolactone biosynthesis protein [Kitasatospora sp. NPDC058397]|uniref:ScbA/BarX family gamma-butyrolactone biosynthesis protein n=1 Tax=unclassified Kitasatospora TaxID=2633591 RepID=UPI0036485F92
MTSNQLSDTEPETVGVISFGRTVERQLVHRTALAEVFVTDMRPVGGDRYLAGAQLPLAHSYYSDHLAASAFDLLLLLEASRQAAVYGAHRFLEVPVRTAFLVNTLAIELDGAAAALRGRLPGELHISTGYPEVERKGDRIRSIVVDQRLYLDGSPVGSATMAVSALTAREHDALRYLQRRDPPSSTADAGPAPAGTAVVPERVGRGRADNVVLADPGWAGGMLRAVVAPRFDNRSLFDHAYDHIPAMVLLEAARQLALLAFAEGAGRAAGRVAVVGATAGFRRFTELDEPVTAAVPAALSEGPAGRWTVPVAFTQGDVTVAKTTVTLACANSVEED